MRAVWVDAGNDPDYGKLAHYEISAAYFDPRDPHVTREYLAAVAAHPPIRAVGLYFAWNWYPTLTAAQFAEEMSATIDRLRLGGNVAVCIDIEKGSGLDNATYVPYVLACLTRWRELRPTRLTSYTLEGMQGGLFDRAAVQAIAATKVLVCPQFYAGDMSPLRHSVIVDLLMAGFAGSRLYGMYDGAALPWRWRGFAFTQGRLP